MLILLFTVVLLNGLMSIAWRIYYKMKIDKLIENIRIKEDFLDIHYKDLSHVMVEIFKRNGYQAKITDKCGEEGNGLILGDTQLIEVWKHSCNQVVEVETAMKLAKCMQSESIYRGMLITLGDFKPNTKAFCHKNVISCINGEQLLALCKEVQKRKEVLQIN